MDASISYRMKTKRQYFEQIMCFHTHVRGSGLDKAIHIN